MTDISAKFRALHRPGDPLVMVNVWDRGTAKMMAALGAEALATSSAALAYTLGRADGGTVTRDESLAHAQDIVSATNLPVQGDFENGFGDDPDICAQTVKLAAEVGLAGICIEDTSFPNQSAYDFDLAVERIRASADAARQLPNDFVLTARADGILTGAYDTEEAIHRIKAFDEVGADCLYAPLPSNMEALAQIVSATQKPVNALVAGHFHRHTKTEFATIGVARISIGSSLARVTQRNMHDLGKAMIEDGDFSGIGQAIPSGLIDGFLN